MDESRRVAQGVKHVARRKQIVSAMEILPYGRHQIEEDDIEAVVAVLRSNALTAGPKAGEFEKEFARKIGVAEAVVCSNGTAALHLAAMACDLGPGDLAIVPTVTFLSTANAIRMTGADVIFADVDPDTGLLTAETLKAAYSDADADVKAVLPVHLNGQCAAMAEISELAGKHNSQIITDCCHALGANYGAGGRPGDGQFEDFGCFSLHPVKSIAMGEGGFVTTNNVEGAARMRLLRSHDMKRAHSEWQETEQAFSKAGEANPWYYEMHELAYNYRATDMQCALGLSQLGKLDRFISRRRNVADMYDQALKRHHNLMQAVPRTAMADSAWHLYPLLIDFEMGGKTRAQVMKELLARGVGTQVHYIPVSNQPYYKKLYGEKCFAGAEAYYGRALSLPIFPAMESEDVEKVVAALVDVLS